MFVATSLTPWTAPIRPSAPGARTSVSDSTRSENSSGAGRDVGPARRADARDRARVGAARAGPVDDERRRPAPVEHAHELVARELRERARLDTTSFGARPRRHRHAAHGRRSPQPHAQPGEQAPALQVVADVARTVRTPGSPAARMRLRTSCPNATPCAYGSAASRKTSAAVGRIDGRVADDARDARARGRLDGRDRARPAGAGGGDRIARPGRAARPPAAPAARPAAVEHERRDLAPAVEPAVGVQPRDRELEADDVRPAALGVRAGQVGDREHRARGGAPAARGTPTASCTGGAVAPSTVT